MSSLNHADFTWKVEYPGKFQTGVEIGDNKDLVDSRIVEGTKDGELFKANISQLEASTKYYYRIVVWNKMSRHEGKVKSFTTLTPDPEPEIYTVTIAANPEEGGTVTGGGEYISNSACIVTATANGGYTFVNWTENNVQVSSDEEYAFPVMGNRNLVANFTSQAYIIQVQVDPEDGGTVEGAGGYNYDDECTLTATPNEGYDFVNWTKGDTEISTELSIAFTVTESGIYVAHFQKKSYTVEVSANPIEGGTVSGGGTYSYGDLCVVAAATNEGYTFVNWTENGGQVSGEAEFTFTVKGNCQLVANFISHACLIQVQIDPEEGGTVTGTGDYDYGQECTLKAIPNEGYDFVNWTKEDGTEVSANATYRFTVTESATYVAHFQKKSYTIEALANPTEGGMVSGGGTFNDGDNCTLTATANTGYVFDHWKKNGTTISGDATISFTVTANASYVAYFTRQTYIITTQSNLDDGGSVSGGGTYTYGESCTVYATANSGYTFRRWTENGNHISTEACYTFIVTSNRTLLANFEQTPVGAISGLFTINDNGDQVYFSHGNLQYQASTNIWRFAINQYDYIGYPNSNISPSYSGWIDLFGWGTSGYDHGAVCYQPWSKTPTDGYYYAYGQRYYNLYDQTGQADWGYNTISNGGNTSNTWRTLTMRINGEWEYVFNIRSASTVNGVANARYAKAKVANTYGMLLFPDNYSHPDGVTQPIGINQSDDVGWNGNNYSVEDFLLMQDAGVVFLPAAGWREETLVRNVGSYGIYWSSSYCDSYFCACYMRFDSDALNTGSCGRDFGQSVRLVTPAE